MGVRGRLAVRLAVCQVLGTCMALAFGPVVSILAGRYMGASFGSFWLDLLLLLYAGVIVFGVPFYCLALLILYAFTASILERPFIWCICFPAGLFVGMLLPFPPQEVGGIFWMALIPLSALFAGAWFYIWLRWRPITA